MSAKLTMAEFPVFKPRYLHLLGYLQLLNGNEFGAASKLRKSMVKSKLVENSEESNWVQHNLSLWEDKHKTTHHEEFWTKSHHSDITVQTNMANAKLKRFTLPHPKWHLLP